MGALPPLDPLVPDVVLSLRQPWAWMVVHGGKSIENRKWNTRFRGAFLVHAAKGMTIDEYGDAVAFAREVDPALRVPARDQLERGGVIGRARLVDVVAPCSEASLFYRPCTHRWHMPEQYGFILADICALPFMPLRGELGFFKLKPLSAAEASDG